MRKLKQLYLLIWKNFTLQKRRPIGTLVQICLPLFMSLVFVLLRIFLIKAERHNAIRWPPYGIIKPPKPMSNKSMIGYSTPAGTNLSKSFLENLTRYINEKSNPGQRITFHHFGSQDEMINFITTETDNDSFIGGVHFSSVPQQSDGHFKYAIRLSYPKTLKNDIKHNSAGREWVTRFVFPEFQLPQPRNEDDSFGANPSYYNTGFLLIQHAIDRAIVNQFGEDNHITVSMQKFPFPNYIKDDFIIIIQQSLPNILVISFIYSALCIVRSVVYEKEKRLKECMKIMGVDNWLHWFAWFIQNFIILFISVLFMTVMFTIKFNDHGKVINKSSGTIFFVFLLLYTVSGIMFCFFLSVFFSKASTAAAGGGIIWYVSFIPYFFIVQSYKDMSLSLKAISCLIPNLGMSLGSMVIGKFEGTGIGVHWDNLFTGASVDDSFSLGTVFLMMILNSVIYGVLAWYFEVIFPGEYGTPLAWYFPFLRSYWCGSYTKVPGDESLPLLNSHADAQKETFEKDPHGLDVGIDIRNLRKVYHGEMGENIAVDNVCLRMYEGQITVLLGHNGAGKTSLMSVLTGFYSPTSGTAVINGYDIKTSMDGVRSSLSLCPQHDVLFDTLTVKEHLWFFGKLKGLGSKEVGSEIEKMQESINLADKSNFQTRFLSGGMKRKLSLGLALIGKSKVVMLDEPTSGMDPSARRFTWDLLQQYRPGRTILLTTHFMDEADVLGDRIAIMAGGKIQCCGSSLFLKKKYGVGYHIVMVKQPRCKVRRITTLINQYVPNAKLESNAGAELSYLLPRESSRNFATLFSQLEDNYQDLGIASYGASMTTMEEVFMKVGMEHDKTLSEKLRSSYGGDAINASEGYEEASERDNLLGAVASSAKSSPPLNSGLLLWTQRWFAMFKKRFLHSKRHKIAIVSQLLMPLVFTMFALIAADTIPRPKDSPPRELSTTMFGSNYAPYATEPSGVSLSLAERYKYFGNKDTQATYINRLPKYKDGNATKYLLDNSGGDKLGYFDRHYLVAATFHQEEHKVNTKAWFNDQAYHAVAVSLNAVDNAILKNVTGNESMHITAINHPLPRTLKEKSNDLNSNGIGINMAFNLLFGMAFLASSFVVFVVQERSNGAKHVQFVSGVDPLSYWTASWCWDLINFVFPCVCIIILIGSFDVPAYAGDHRLGIVFLVLILYGFAIIPFMYLFSFFFKVASKAYIRLTLLNIVTGLVALLVIFVLNLLDYQDTSEALNWIFLFLPNYSLGQTLANMFTNYNNLLLYNEIFENCEQKYSKDFCETYVDVIIENTDTLNFKYQKDYLAFATPGVGRFLLVLPFEGLFFMFLVLAIDYGFFRTLASLFRRGARSDPFDDAHKDVEEDSDVFDERRRVLEQDCADDVLVIKDLTKTFKVPGRPVFAAVDHISLGVPRGECFGLLGVNGAGKTTTFKMLTGDENPTLGTASVESFDIGSELNQVRQRTGYCPQFDALIDLMTGREMLRMYAALRGVVSDHIEPLVDELMHSLLLTEHADKLTKAYSGGNKRKLSAAIALVGDPLVVFLDEPTTGMDPVARRLLWNALCRVRADGRCLVITSHSMEECEALCTRLAIMVNGRFRCLGGPQHLKNKFVQGFTLLVNPPDEFQSPEDIASLKQYIQSIFPDSVLRDEHNGLLNYHLKGADKAWSTLFATLESAHEQGSIGNYAITQTTLEQIFLNFARSQKGYED